MEPNGRSSLLSDFLIRKEDILSKRSRNLYFYRQRERERERERERNRHLNNCEWMNQIQVNECQWEKKNLPLPHLMKVLCRLKKQFYITHTHTNWHCKLTWTKEAFEIEIFQHSTCNFIQRLTLDSQWNIQQKLICSPTDSYYLRLLHYFGHFFHPLSLSLSLSLSSHQESQI